ncbi:MAG: anhydro-N-acetylmuramic acid kinase [Ferruginibacter sp.]
MIYRAIGIMSGSSLDGLDIAFTEFTETGGKWSYEIIVADCIEYDTLLRSQLAEAIHLNALNYQLLHTAYGHYIGGEVNKFIAAHNLHHKVHLVASHGHTTFHLPAKKMTAQLGDGAAIAAVTKLPVVSDLRSLDIALGGQGAPIVPVGEKLLFEGYNFFLNIGGIANVSVKKGDNYIAYDICAANRVLNMLAQQKGFEFDEGGKLAAAGKVNNALLEYLNSLEYYQLPYPKSLANSFGIEVVYPAIQAAGVSTEDALSTYTEHICSQVYNAVSNFAGDAGLKMLVTGGGAFNRFLIERLSTLLTPLNIEVVVPEENLVKYKEAVIMALIGILRWREEPNTLPSVTGALQAGIGGALWLGGQG